MAELQSFVGGVPLAETAAPRNLGSGATDAVGAVSSLLTTGARIQSDTKKREADELVLAEDAGVAQAYITNEALKRETPLQQAVAEGQISSDEALNFGVDIQASMDALNQVSAQGMRNSVKASLHRSLNFQQAATRNPGAAARIAAAMGIGNNSTINTLSEQATIQREQEKALGDEARRLLLIEGHLFNGTNIEAAQAWTTSDMSNRNIRIQQSKRRTEDYAVSIAERAPHASEALMLISTMTSNRLSNVAKNFKKGGKTNFSGSDGTTQSLAEQYVLEGEAMKREAALQYAQFPENLKVYNNHVDNMIKLRVQSEKDGHAIFGLEIKNTVLDPLAIQSAQLRVAQDTFNVGQQPLLAFKNATEAQYRVVQAITTMTKDIDNAAGDQAANPKLHELVTSQNMVDRMGNMVARLEQTNVAILGLLDPEKGNMKQAANDAVATISFLAAHPEDDENNAKLAKMIGIFDQAYRNNITLSPSYIKPMQDAVMKLVANDQDFVDTIAGSEMGRRMVKPIADALLTELSDSMRVFINDTVDDGIGSLFTGRLLGSDESPWKLYTNLGQWLVVDTVATDKAGVPQYKLRDGIENKLSPAAVTKNQLALVPYNDDIRSRQDPARFAALSKLRGDGSISQTVLRIIRSSDGIAMESLDPAVSIPEIDKEALEAQLKRNQPTDLNPY